MAKFGRGEARAWSLENLRGVTGCVMPSFSADLSGLNEPGIRHDIRREKELGFSGFLIVSECGTTREELRRFIDIAVEEAAETQVTVIQAAASTLAENIEVAQYAEAAGVDLILPSYPLSFYPAKAEEVIAYTSQLAAASNLGMIVFAMNLWNFARLHPSGFAPSWLEELVDGAPNVVAIKNETGEPGIAGQADVFRRLAGRVMVADPLEMNAPAWTQIFGMPWMGTSNYEYFGDEVPRYFDLLQRADGYEDAMEIYWRLHPARSASGVLMKESNAGGSLVHRLLWKYQGWLQGFNGGPMRAPHLRLHDRQMKMLRGAAAESGLTVAPGDDADFFVGRVAA